MAALQYSAPDPVTDLTQGRPDLPENPKKPENGKVTNSPQNPHTIPVSVSGSSR